MPMKTKNIVNAGARRTALLALLFPLAMSAVGQDEATDDIIEEAENGYAKVYIEVKAVPADKTGKVLKLSKTTSQIVWLTDWVLPSSSTLAAQKNATVEISEGSGKFYLWTIAGQTDSSYKLASFYLDNGDGEFDMSEDEQLTVGAYNEAGNLVVMDNTAAVGSAPNYLIAFSSTLVDVYETQEVAVSSTLPDKPQILIYAYYSNGDFASVTDATSQFGTATVSDPFNKPGDEITLTATPYEGYEFAYWKDQLTEGGSIVSRDNPMTVTVVGGKTYYAVFHQTDAPTLEFPEEGGFMMVESNKVWEADEFSDFVNYLLNADDVVEQNGRLVLNLDEADGLTIPNTKKVKTIGTTTSSWWEWRCPNFVYGKGKVKMAFQRASGAADGRSGSRVILATEPGKNVTLSTGGTNKFTGTVYLWNEQRQAFLRLGDTYEGRTVVVPANSSYLIVRDENQTDYQAVGTSADAYDDGVAYLLSKETMEVGPEGMATYVTKNAVDMSTAKQLTAYRATMADGELTFSKATRVAAGTPLLLRSLSGAAASEDVGIIAGARSYANLLKTGNQEADGVPYALAYGECGYAFYSAEGLTLTEDDVYLDLPTDLLPAYSIIFDGVTTQVPAVAATNGDTSQLPVYDLQGRKVGTTASRLSAHTSRPLNKGLYIVGGQKLIVTRR